MACFTKGTTSEDSVTMTFGAESLTNSQFTNTINLSGAGKLILKTYSVRGAPTTAGVPNYTYYNLKLEGQGIDFAVKIKRHDQLTGVPLQLTGAMTHEHLSEGLEIGTLNPSKGAVQITGTVQTPTGGAATLDAIFLKCTFLPNNGPVYR